MTQLTQTQRRSPATMIAGVAIAAAVLGGLVGTRVEGIVQGLGQDGPTISAHDQAVLKAAQEWEVRYRQIYPNSR